MTYLQIGCTRRDCCWIIVHGEWSPAGLKRQHRHQHPLIPDLFNAWEHRPAVHLSSLAGQHIDVLCDILRSAQSGRMKVKGEKATSIASNSNITAKVIHRCICRLMASIIILIKHKSTLTILNLAALKSSLPHNLLDYWELPVWRRITQLDVAKDI